MKTQQSTEKGGPKSGGLSLKRGKEQPVTDVDEQNEDQPSVADEVTEQPKPKRAKTVASKTTAKKPAQMVAKKTTKRKAGSDAENDASVTQAKEADVQPSPLKKLKQVNLFINLIYR